MAVLKSLFTTRGKFASPNDGLSPLVKTPLRFHTCAWVAIALFIVCGLSVKPGNILAAKPAADGTALKSQQQSEASATANAQILVEQGNDRLSHKDFAAAEAAFREAIAQDPTLAVAHRGLGLALWEQGNAEAAWKELRLAARLDPGSASAHYVLSQLAWFLYQHPPAQGGGIQGLSPGDYQALALSEAEKAAELDPRNFKMRLNLAELNLAVGRDKQAQSDAAKAIPLASTPVERSNGHVTLARALVSTDEEDAAEAEYKKALKDNPANGMAYLSLGQLRLFQRKPAEAASYFHRAIQVSPDLEPAYVALAELLQKAHDYAEARALFEKAVALNPQDWRARYQLAVLLMEGGQSARAKDMLTRIVAEQEDFLPAREQLALLLLRQGDLEGALAQAQTLIARDPQAEEGHRVMALVRWRERKLDSSLAECALALAANPHSASMLLLQSIELWQEKRKRDAQAAFRQAAQADPDVGSASTFCRLIACDSQDIPLVDEFLKKNRWILYPPGTE